jgi:hypothetical protein
MVLEGRYDRHRNIKVMNTDIRPILAPPHSPDYDLRLLAPAIALARRERLLQRVLLGMLILACGYGLAVLWRGLFQPLLDQYSFRQTQTAFSTYWLVRGGPIFAYETPVAGFPWSIPFEFPLYQMIVALLSRSGLPLEAAGRVVSFGFFVGCLWPMHVLFRALRFDSTAFLCVAILFLLSPIYVFWSRTFMIETCAVFFSLCWLAYLARYLREPRPIFMAFATVAGVLGILVKATTFPAFAVLGGIIFLRESYMTWRDQFPAGGIRVMLLAAVAVAAPFLIGVLWTVYSDSVKADNEFGMLLTSRAVAEFTFGTWDQRISSALWRDAILDRTLTNTFGYATVPAVVLIGATLSRREYAYPALAAVLAFLVPFLVFTNLHVVHGYYQTANAIFIIAAVGLGLASVISAKQTGIALAFLATIAAGQLLYFRSAYAGLLTQNFSADREFRIANIAKSATEPDAGLIVIGDDWSSAIPYYAQRKSLALPNWVPVSLWQQTLATPQKFLDGDRLGGVVFCADTGPHDAERQMLVSEFVSGRAVLGEAGGCQFLAPDKK